VSDNLNADPIYFEVAVRSTISSQQYLFSETSAVYFLPRQICAGVLRAVAYFVLSLLGELTYISTFWVATVEPFDW